MTKWVRGGSALLWIFFLAGSLRAQTPATRTAPPRLRVFIDCQYECDTQYLRQNIEFIEYVRDRAAADVHLLVTTQETGGGGMAWNLKFINTDRSLGASPAIEFDFFPYSMSTRRSLTVQYSIGMTTYRYRELTIFDKLEESVPSHSVNTSIGIRAPWGSVGGSVNISQHLNHTDRYHVGMYGNTDVRLFKGFSFDIYANYDKIGDQIGLAKGDISEAEVLLRLRQRATGYSYYMGFGVSYSFGSIFNSTVNPRFGGF